jgi:GT2 family glycosyltransferase
MTLALGTKVFSRADDLRGLLRTLPEDLFGDVYVADDGEPSPEKGAVYDEFDVRHLDLPYDAGASAGRNAVVDAASEDYICIVDPDHRVPSNVSTLVDQLERDDQLGGVGGVLVEPEQNRIRYEGQDFDERDGGRTLVRSPLLEDKTISTVAGSPFVPFQFIPNAAVFRREVLVEYPWDEEFVVEGEHLDYYLTHWKRSEWSFGINPAVQFLHYPGGDADYVAERESDEKDAASKAYLLDKWGYDRIDLDSYTWATVTGGRHGQLSLYENAARVLREDGPMTLLRNAITRGRDRLQTDSSW